MRKIAIVLLLVFAFALASPVPVCRADAEQHVTTQIVKKRQARPISHREHVERMTLIICATVVIILVLIIAWRMNK